MSPTASGGNRGLAPDRIGKRYLVARARARSSASWTLPPLEQSMRSMPDGLQSPGEHDRLREVPAALVPVGGREAVEHGLVRGPRLAHRPRHRERASECDCRASRRIRRCAGSKAASRSCAAGSRARRGLRPRRSPRRARIPPRAGIRSTTRLDLRHAHRTRHRIVAERRSRSAPASARRRPGARAACRLPTACCTRPCAPHARAGSPAPSRARA